MRRAMSKEVSTVYGGQQVKCPVCGARVTLSSQGDAGIYVCSNCKTPLKHRLSTLWFVVFLVVGLPIIELPVRAIVESIVFAPDVHSHLGGFLPYAISFTFAFAAAYIAYRAFDQLVPIAKEPETVDDDGRGAS